MIGPRHLLLALIVLLAAVGSDRATAGTRIVSIIGDRVALSAGAAEGVRVRMQAYVTVTERVGGQTVRMRLAGLTIDRVESGWSEGRVGRIGEGWALTEGMEVEFTSPLEPPPPVPRPSTRPEPSTTRPRVDELLGKMLDSQQRGEAGETLELARRILKSDPDNEEALAVESAFLDLIARADRHRLRNDWDRAVDLYAEAAEIDPRQKNLKRRVDSACGMAAEDGAGVAAEKCRRLLSRMP